MTRRPGSSDAPGLRTTSLALTSDPRGPSLALIGPAPDGTYTLSLAGAGREHHVADLDATYTGAALLRLALQVDEPTLTDDTL